MNATRRLPGTGAMFVRSDGLWVGQVELPTQRGQKRQSKRGASQTFCGMLKKFSALPHRTRPPVRSRRENLSAAQFRGTHTDAEWIAKVRAQEGICFYCHEVPFDKVPRLIMGRLRHLTVPLMKDHKIPISREGSDAIDNIVGCCGPCNREKGTMTADEYIRYRARKIPR